MGAIGRPPAEPSHPPAGRQGGYDRPIAGIGTLNESSLHAGLRAALSRPGDRFEVEVEGFVADIARGDLLIEIQTGSFGAMARKLDHLLARYQIRIVHPIAVETLLHRPGARPRRSPRRGDVYALFDELVSFPTLLDHPNLAIEVALVVVDQHQVRAPAKARGRGGWRTVDRQLREVRAAYRFEAVTDLLALLPTGLPPVFTTADLARASGTSLERAQRMAFCLRANDLVRAVGRTRRGVLYQTLQTGQ